MHQIDHEIKYLILSILVAIHPNDYHELEKGWDNHGRILDGKLKQFRPFPKFKKMKIPPLMLY